MISVKVKVSREFDELLRCRGDKAIGLERRIFAVPRWRLGDLCRVDLVARNLSALCQSVHAIDWAAEAGVSRSRRKRRSSSKRSCHRARPAAFFNRRT